MLANNIEEMVNKDSFEMNNFALNGYNYFLTNFERKIIYDKLYNLGYELNIWYKLPPQKTFGKESKTEFRIQDVVDGKIIFLERSNQKKERHNRGKN